MNAQTLTPSLTLRIADVGLQIYLQDWSYLTGPNRQNNEKLFQALGTNLKLHAPVERAPIEELRGGPDAHLPAGDKVAIAALLRTLALPADRLTGLCNYFGWKIARAPRRARNILAIGCAGADECIVLRALFPDAALSGCDFDLRLPDDRAELLGLAAEACPIDDYLEKRPAQFDLVFSNHTLEHLTDPAKVIARVYSAISPGGTFVSGIPIEAHASNPFYKEVCALAESGRVPYWLDLESLWMAHVWKTNPDHLLSVLKECGFENIRFYRRSDYPTAWRNHDPIDGDTTRKWLAAGRRLEKVTLAPLRATLKAVFGRSPPAWIVKRYYQTAQRLWFSKMRLVPLCIHEVAFVAKKPAG